MAQTNEEDCKRHCPAKLCRRGELGYQRQRQQSPESDDGPKGKASSRNLALIPMSSVDTPRSRRPNKAIDFSHVHMREQVKALARLAELCPAAESDVTTAVINTDAEAISSRRQLRRRQRPVAAAAGAAGAAGAGAGAGAAPSESDSVSSDATPDSEQIAVRAGSLQAAPQPPPTSAGVVDMLSDPVRSCMCLTNIQWIASSTS